MRSCDAGGSRSRVTAHEPFFFRMAHKQATTKSANIFVVDGPAGLSPPPGLACVCRDAGVDGERRRVDGLRDEFDRVFPCLCVSVSIVYREVSVSSSQEAEIRVLLLN